MNKFEKLKKHIEEKAKIHTENYDKAMEIYHGNYNESIKKMAYKAADSHRIRLNALFEIIDFMNNMED